MSMNNIKYIFVFLFLVFVPVSLWSRGADYVPLYQVAYHDVEIMQVSRSDTATVIDMKCTQIPGDELWISDSPLYLNDEQQRRYPLRYAKGIDFGKANIIPYSGVLSFTLVFAPIPADVKCFDLVPSYVNSYPFAFWGIHQAGKSIKGIKNMVTKRNYQKEYVLIPGKSVIKGQVENYKYTGIVDTLIVRTVYHEDGNVRVSRNEAFIDQAGRFQFDGIYIENTTWLYIDGSQLHLPVMINPQDTLSIRIENMREYDMKVDYSSAKGYDVMSHLMSADPSFVDSEQMMQKTNRIRVTDLHREMILRKEKNLRFCEYLSWKYALSDQEAHILLLSMNSVVDEVAIQRLNRNVWEVYLHEPATHLQSWFDNLSLLPEIMESYGFVSDISLKDYTYFILPNQYLVTHLAGIQPVVFPRGRSNRINALQQYLKQEIDSEWDKRICF